MDRLTSFLSNFKRGSFLVPKGAEDVELCEFAENLGFLEVVDVAWNTGNMYRITDKGKEFVEQYHLLYKNKLSDL